MPRRLTHIVGGLILSLPLVGVSYWGFSEDFDYLQLILVLSLSVVCAFVGSILPDLIERPTSPNHRKFFHSWFMLSVFFIASFVMCFVLVPLYDTKVFVYLIFAFLLGYLSHLLLDATTKKGLKGNDRSF
ncbi:MAG: metal-dependent hydrolase [Candidatus Heimdallarchaeaceae archaeon]